MQTNNENVKYELVVCDVEDFTVIGLVLPLDSGKFKKGEDVLLSSYYAEENEFYTRKLKITDIVYATDNDLPCDVYDLAIAIKIPDNLAINYKKIDPSKVNSDRMLELFNNTLPIQNRNYELIYLCNIIIGFFDDDLMRDYIDNKSYVSVYLNEASTYYNLDKLLIYSFNDFLKLFYMIGSNDEGICVHCYKETYFVNKIDLLWIYINSILFSVVRTKNLLASLNQREIDFIGKKEYYILSLIYQDNMDEKQICNHTGLTKEDVEKTAKHGYENLKHLIKSKLLQ